MSVVNYKLWAMGGRVLARPGQRPGIMGAVHVGIAAIAKKALPTDPLALVNEIVCAELGRGLGLPIPPNALVRHNGEDYFFSLDFNLSGESLPPCLPERVVAEQASLSCGVILFDSWIVNADRHAQNLAYLTSERRLQVFDHGHALLADSNMQRYADRLPLDWHCLAQEVTSLAEMNTWIQRMNAVPDFWIDDALEAGRAGGLLTEDVSPLRNFLLRRRERMPTMLRESRGMFPKVDPELWATFEDGLQ